MLRNTRSKLINTFPLGYDYIQNFLYVSQVYKQT
jgi:hypothetical protein